MVLAGGECIGYYEAKSLVAHRMREEQGGGSEDFPTSSIASSPQYGAQSPLSIQLDTDDIHQLTPIEVKSPQVDPTSRPYEFGPARVCTLTSRPPQVNPTRGRPRVDPRVCTPTSRTIPPRVALPQQVALLQLNPMLGAERVINDFFSPHDHHGPHITGLGFECRCGMPLRRFARDVGG